VQGVFDWLTGLPPVALYVLLFVMSALENVFPPLPSDTVVAFGSFLAARGHASLGIVMGVTWSGNVVGALGMYRLGQRYGAARLHRWLARKGEGGAERTFNVLYGRYGMPAVFLSRFLPGVRAVVPPAAGALQIPWRRTAAAIACASAIWYGLITVLAYRIGENWELVLRRIGSTQRALSLAALGAGLLLIALLAVRRRRARRNPARPHVGAANPTDGSEGPVR
jgi:membrane protein DedA with SNARE-associated domain